MKHKIFRVVCRFIVLMSLVPGVQAQSNQGALTGTIFDSTGLVVEGAVVKVTNVATGQVAQTLTTSSGNYRLPSLIVGDYTVAVSRGGFKTAERTGDSRPQSELV